MESIKPEELVIGQYYVVRRENSTDEYIFKHTVSNRSPYIGGFNTHSGLSKADFISYCKIKYNRHTRHASYIERSWLDMSIARGKKVEEPKNEMYEIY